MSVQLVVGRVGRPHGIRGQVTVEVRTDDPAGRFRPGTVLRTDPAARGPLTVGDLHWHGGRLLLSFVGVEDRSAAESLRGLLLVVEQDEAARPEDPDEYFDHQIVGLAAVTVDGAPLGTVADVLHLPAQDVLVVRRDGGSGEALVPFVIELVPEVDLPGGRVVLAPPPGLLELGPDPSPDPGGGSGS